MRTGAVALLIALFACGETPVQTFDCNSQVLRIWATQNVHPEVCPGGDPGTLESAYSDDTDVVAASVDGDKLIIRGGEPGSTRVMVRTSNAGDVHFAVTVNEAVEAVITVCEETDFHGNPGITVKGRVTALTTLAEFRFYVSAGSFQSPEWHVGDLEAGRSIIFGMGGVSLEDQTFGACALHPDYVVVG